MNWAAINDLSLNWLDWGIIIVLILSTLVSLWRGFVREALSLAAWVIAFVVATVFADQLALAMQNVIENATGRYIAAYVVLFVGVLVLGTVVNGMMRRFIKLAGLSGLDRLLGTVFGFTRGLIVVLVAVYIARELLPLQNQRAIMESDLMPHLEIVAQWMRSVLGDLSNGLPHGISV